MNQTNPTKCESSSFSFSALLLLLNTVMLASLTILHNPLVKVADNLTDKYQKEQRALVCSEVLAYKEVFNGASRTIFKSGCVSTVRDKYLQDLDSNKKLSKEEKKVLREGIDVMFKERNSLEYEKVENYCAGRAGDYEEQQEISKHILSNMFYELKCDSFGKTVQESIMEIYRIVDEVKTKEKSK